MTAGLGASMLSARGTLADSHDRYLEMSATDVVRSIRDGDMRAEDYASKLVLRCQSASALNAVTWINPDQTLSDARAVDQARARGTALGMVAGLPLLVKDNIDTVGFPSSAATPTLKSNQPKKNAPVIESLLSKGAIVLAKANMAELALSATSSESAFGPVHNPYDPGRFAGGSSGGTAAGIAARLAPAGLGTDTAGSGRIPAAFCGVVGFRPTTQPKRAYPNSGIVPLARLLDSVAPMARTVQDVALLHAALAGEAPAPPLPLTGTRLGIARRFLWDDLEPEVARITDQAIQRLRDAGVEFVELNLADIPEASWSLQRSMMLVGMKKDLDGYLKEAGSPVAATEVLAGIQAPQISALFKTAGGMPMTAEQEKQVTEVQAPALRRRYDTLLQEKGVAGIVFPCEAWQAQRIKLPTDSSPWIVDGKEVGQGMLSRNTRMAAALGVPALTLPTGLTTEGLPVSLEFDAAGGDDAKLLGLCQSAEKVLGRIPAPRT
jgi:Asp-tRNA(Asn)/Glu-tRNA(Gln) amidotransferase A subunit family amidase